MMMYDDLIKQLRYCADATTCRNCLWKTECCPTDMQKKAADAIEKLNISAENGEATYEIMVRQTSYIEELKQKIPHWIPVEEQLPEEYKDVLCYYEYFRYGDFNRMFRTIDRGYYVNGRWGGEAGQGYKNKVLAWMPLPEPPKEGE